MHHAWRIALALAVLIALAAAALAAFRRAPPKRKAGGGGGGGGWPWWAAVPLVLAGAVAVAGLVVLAAVLLRRRFGCLAPPAAQAGGGWGAQAQTGGGGGGQCAAAAAHACGAEDPVSEPSYNMREIAKQSILLEEHLVEKNKRCKDCICKHFMHIIALAEEAQMLAGSKVAKYPLMGDSATFYNALFKQWLQKRTDDATQRRIEELLRARRKQLVERYVLGAAPAGA